MNGCFRGIRTHATTSKIARLLLKDRVKIPYLFAFFLLGCMCQAPSLPAQIDTDKINELCSAYHGDDRFSGVILVSRNGNILFKKAYGLADRELNIPVHADMKFKIGSLSKPFTATLILQLIDEGILELEDHITDHLPEYRGEGGDRITVEQLLTHTSGIIQGPGPEKEALVERMPHHLPDLIHMTDSADLCFDPGTGFRYSNTGYQILAYMAERVGHSSFDSLMQERIFQPLGMTDTRQYNALHIEPGLARGYEYKLLKGYENASFIDPSYALGAGGLISTVNDLEKFARGLDDGKLISEDLYRRMIQPSDHADYGYGWEISQRYHPDLQDTIRFISHSGSINGFGAYMAHIARDSLFVVVLKNCRSDTYIAPSYAPQIGREILSIIYHEPVILPRRSAALEIGRILGHEGPKRALETYHHLKASAPEAYLFAEDEFNKLGIELLFGHHRPYDALKIFALNMREYPLSYNTYDSYAYVLKELGDYRNAIRYYKMGLKILETYPGCNQNESVLKDAENALRSIQEMERMIEKG